MKRINIFLLFIVLLFTSCSFKHKADSRLKSYVASVIADPDFSIEEKEFVWDDDSLCIIDFKLRARNAFGGYVLNDYEYVLVRNNGITYEQLINTEKKLPIYTHALNHFRNWGAQQNEGEYAMVLHMIAVDEASRHGRIVE